MLFRNFIYFFFISILCSCEEIIVSEGIEGIIVCNTSNLATSESDNIVIPDATEPILWEGTYSDTSVKISFTKKVGNNDETETFIFVFNKVGNCLEIARAYEYYYGSNFDVSAITEMPIFDLKIKDWEIDKKFTGQITYRDHHDKQVYKTKFWLEFTEDDYEIEDKTYTSFSNCLENKLPINIDLNKDGNTDFILGYEEESNTGNTPNFSSYTIKLVSAHDDDSNLILSPKKDSSPYFIIFNPPFSSENTIKYHTGVKNTLDVFYEYEAPYQDYNYFLNNNLTYSQILEDNKVDYFLIRMTISDKHYYGWIKLNFQATSCSFNIVETYLHDVENEHIYIQ
jgi:hypothetical protein